MLRTWVLKIRRSPLSSSRPEFLKTLGHNVSEQMRVDLSTHPFAKEDAWARANIMCEVDASDLIFEDKA